MFDRISLLYDLGIVLILISTSKIIKIQHRFTFLYCISNRLRQRTVGSKILYVCNKHKFCKFSRLICRENIVPQSGDYYKQNYHRRISSFVKQRYLIPDPTVAFRVQFLVEVSHTQKLQRVASRTRNRSNVSRRGLVLVNPRIEVHIFKIYLVI